MTPAAATALLASALAALDGTAAEVRVSGRSELSAVTFSAGGAAARQLAATDVLPRAELRLDHKTLRLTLAYEPQLRASQVLSYGGGDAALVHGGSARAEWDVDPLWRVTAAGRASLRLMNFIAPSGGELARLLDMRASPAALEYSDAGASVGAEGRVTRLVTVTAHAAVDTSAGLGAEGHAAMPGMRELRLAGGVSRAQTRQDLWRLDVAFGAAAFDVGSSASLATLSAGWTREATRSLRLRAAVAASEALAGRAPARVMPGAEAALEATPALLDRPLRASLTARFGPAFDRFNARIQEQIAVEGAATWAVTPRWSVGALAALGRIREAQGYTASRVDLRAAWRASPTVTLYADVWNEWRRDPRLAALASTSYLGTSVGVELTPVARWIP